MDNLIIRWKVSHREIDGQRLLQDVELSWDQAAPIHGTWNLWNCTTIEHHVELIMCCMGVGVVHYPITNRSTSLGQGRHIIVKRMVEVWSDEWVIQCGSADTTIHGGVRHRTLLRAIAVMTLLRPFCGEDLRLDSRWWR